ncbi:hypothetical protein Pfo_007605 [Paulownia fortunei]|nr:hypothetical protein Pfo_007605 [Paulownia fortunei]
MNLLTWNIRGIGNEPTQKHLYNFCQLHRVKIMAIMEPKVHLDSTFFCWRLGFSRVIANCSNKVWCFVDQDFEMDVIKDHEQLRLTSLNDFADMISDCGLIDAGYVGNCYTWTNHRVWKRLDRMLYSEHWLDPFHNTKVSHLPRIWSDHAPLLATLSFQLDKTPSPFRFMNMWTRHQSFLEVVRNSWQNSTGMAGMINLQQKLYRTKQLLRWWNKNVFGDIFENIKKAGKEVSLKEQMFDANPIDENLIELKRCSAVLTHALIIEKDFWKQKAACRWINDGERNTAFFHSLVKKKKM